MIEGGVGHIQAPIIFRNGCLLLTKARIEAVMKVQFCAVRLLRGSHRS